MLFCIFYRYVSQNINVTKKIKKHLTKQRYNHFSKYKISYFLKNKFIFKSLKLYFFHTKKWKFYDNFFLYHFFAVDVKKRFYSLKFITKQFLKKNSGAYFNEKLFKRSVYNSIYMYNRFDLVLYRVGFVSSLKFARQLILHGFFLINNIIIKNPNFLLSRGDLVEVNSKKVDFLRFYNKRVNYLKYSKAAHYMFVIFDKFAVHKIFYFKRFLQQNLLKNIKYLKKIIYIDLFNIIILNKIYNFLLINFKILNKSNYKKLINILYFSFKNIKFNLKININQKNNLNILLLKNVIFINKYIIFINNFIKLLNYYNFIKNILLFSIEKYYLRTLLLNFKLVKMCFNHGILQKLYHLYFYLKYSYYCSFEMIRVNKRNSRKRIVPYKFRNRYHVSYEERTAKISKRKLLSLSTIFYTYRLKLFNLSEINNKTYYYKQFLNLNKTYKQYSDVEIDFLHFRFIYLDINSNYLKKSLLSQNLISTFILRFYK